MTVELAPRPENEERRAQAVVKTGMLDNDQGDLFQICLLYTSPSPRD